MKRWRRGTGNDIDIPTSSKSTTTRIGNPLFNPLKNKIGDQIEHVTALGGKRKHRIEDFLDDKTRSKTPKTTILKTGFEQFYSLEKKLVADSAVSNPFQVQVRTAIHKPTGERRVIKVLNRETVDIMKIKREVSVMVGLQPHPNVVQFYEAFQDESRVYICMEYVRGGELFDQLVKHGRYSERRAAQIIRGLILGLSHIHKAGIAHCDIKPENVMFASNGQDSDVKIIDFGMSQRVSLGKINWLSAQCGTIAYRSPEQVERKYSRSCDMWAVGVTMFMLLTGYGPFHNPSLKTTLERIREGFHAELRPGYGNWFPKDKLLTISRAAKSLIAQLLDREDFRRLTPDEALRHPWLNDDMPTNQLLAVRVVEHLQKERAMNRFHTSICTALSQWIPKGEMYLLEAAFRGIDTNEDGVISIDEFRNAVRTFNKSHPQPLSKDAIVKLFNNGDLNNDQHIDYRELILACTHQRILSSEERLWRVFCELDKDNDNYVTKAELGNVVDKCNKEAKDLLDKLDTDRDGKISYTEFVNLWKGYT
eukprot:jgi/Bigna1/78442/fgenesh1_pg.54_\